MSIPAVPQNFESMVGKLADKAINLLPTLREGASIHDAAMLVVMETMRTIDSGASKVYASVVSELFQRKKLERLLDSQSTSGYTSAAHSHKN
jgi:hypothetical protein